MAGVGSKRMTRQEGEELSRQLLAGRHPPVSADGADGARTAAHQVMVDGLRDSWRGPEAGGSFSRGEREEVFQASISAAEATRQRVADRRTNGRQAAEDERDGMITRLRNSWKV